MISLEYLCMIEFQNFFEIQISRISQRSRILESLGDIEFQNLLEYIEFQNFLEIQNSRISLRYIILESLRVIELQNLLEIYNSRIFQNMQNSKISWRYRILEFEIQSSRSSLRYRILECLEHRLFTNNRQDTGCRLFNIQEFFVHNNPEAEV